MLTNQKKKPWIWSRVSVKVEWNNGAEQSRAEQERNGTEKQLPPSIMIFPKKTTKRALCRVPNHLPIKDIFNRSTCNVIHVFQVP